MAHERLEGDVIIQSRDGSRTRLLLRVGTEVRAQFVSRHFNRWIPWLQGRFVRIHPNDFVEDLGASRYCVELHHEIKQMLAAGVDPLPLAKRPERLWCVRTSGVHAWRDFTKKLAGACHIAAERVVDMTNPCALASEVQALLSRADAATDALVIVRGGGDAVAALDHVEVAIALFEAARALPTVLAVGHSTDDLRVERVLHPELVMDVPADAGRLLAELPVCGPNDHGADQPEHAQMIGVDGTYGPGATTEVVISAPTQTIVQPVILVPTPVGASQSLPPRRSLFQRWRRALVLLGVLAVTGLAAKALVGDGAEEQQTRGGRATAQAGPAAASATPRAQVSEQTTQAAQMKPSSPPPRRPVRPRAKKPAASAEPSTASSSGVASAASKLQELAADAPESALQPTTPRTQDVAQPPARPLDHPSAAAVGARA